MKNIAFIGAGNMGGSIIGGLIKNGYPASKIWATNKDVQVLTQLKQEFQINIGQENESACQQADIVVLCLKPQIMQEVVLSLADHIKENALIISIATGISSESLQAWLGANKAIVRCMPNTPALIQAGATGLYANKSVSQEQKNLAESILRAVGITVWLEDEALLDAVTAVSGSGPAYFFLIMEAMQDVAQQLGLDEKNAKLLILQTCFGAAKMALESQADLQTLRKRVTSPGGTTEQAVAVLEKNKIRTIFQDALQAAQDRAKELAQ